jgi:endonuclease YncB( thermonuclease family)
MTHNLIIRGLAENTQKAHLQAVTGLARYYRRSPDRLSAQDVQAYLVWLHEERHLGWPGTHFYLAGAEEPSKLSEVLSQEEPVRLFTVTTNGKQRALLMTTYAAGRRASEVTRLKVTGIDALELGQRYGQASKARLSRRVAGRFVVVNWEKRDRYKRLVGKVLVSDQDVCLEQVQAALAWHYKKYQYEQPPEDRAAYAEAEEEAGEARHGLWVDPRPVPPWDWRRGRRSVAPTLRHPNSSGFTCGTKRCCRDMSSGEEVLCDLRQCGLAGRGGVPSGPLG